MVKFLSKNYLRLRTSIVCFLLPISVFSQRTKTVECEYIYYPPYNLSIEQARLTALERAQIQAIADAFGTTVSRNNTLLTKNTNGKSNIDLQSIGHSEVKGEWVETIGNPTYDIYTEENILVIKVKVKGRIREISSSHVDLIADILCNETNHEHECCDFHNGDVLYVRFQSPIDGYVAIYLVDYSTRSVYCLLPYSQMNIASYPIVHDHPYIFFSRKEAEEKDRPLVDEYKLTTSSAADRNDVYIIFSQNEFTKANSQRNQDDLWIKELSWSQFNEWLAKVRRHDAKLQVISKPITIKQ